MYNLSSNGKLSMWYSPYVQFICNFSAHALARWPFVLLHAVAYFFLFLGFDFVIFFNLQTNARTHTHCVQSNPTVSIFTVEMEL